MLLSQTQVLKAINLYKIVLEIESGKKEIYSKDALIGYIRTLPKSILEELD